MSMTSKHVQTILNGAIYTLKQIIPMNINIQSPSFLTEPFTHKEIGVLVGLTGDIKGRVILDSTSAIFSAIGMKMFGMNLEGEMLKSFTGEFGNMFAGNLSIQASEKQLFIDVTPPTILIGKTTLHGIDNAIKLPTIIEDIGMLTVLLTIDNK
ncbi:MULTISPECIES: chemotaxis protein CheX [Ureibacillus]|uniref:Chemotaxis protein CheX n=2 Tax=Caryophanaceae TaxID=186818 RepID=A0A840PR78_URETH|nr:chemotaxis protein CheX [Ureibacillus thermosphaericus]MBB5147634.1 chemotaxis protein CheX [Ureibacillus thermosphaericus]NKZ30561.1 chemotaxis protein CheX [Ureibacillus thermosphaericus]